ncbi:MupA/Atu3671 family FMN-dependent luciferase-like monooxygenase [Streptomyces pratensis]|uniref:MupA/Atu3671 family FMN-dependent luciferase-like monooxygenase n=1 Tax=Streptomyces pratensis TaxID=1169025 RepID=UPI00363D9389
MTVVERVGALVGELLEIRDEVPAETPLLDLGADSLVLIELSHRVEQDFGVEISVQQLFEDVVTVDAVARWIEQEQPEAAATSTGTAQETPTALVERIGALVGELLEIRHEVPAETPLLDLGADSLVLIELSHRVEQDFGVEISVQQLFEDVVTVDAVARWIEQEQPEAAATSTGTAQETPTALVERIGALVGELLEIRHEVPAETPLLDLGADSLVLIELSHRVEQDFGVEISVQQLFEDVVTVDAVARWIEQEAPSAALPAAASVPDPAPSASAPVPSAPAPAAPVVPVPASAVPVRTVAPVAAVAPEPAVRAVQEPARRPAAARTFAEATAESLRLSETYQDILCNNRRFAERDESERAGSYPVWVTKSDGPYVWDADGNRLVDIAMGYGSHLFGHNPAFVTEALRHQLDQGIHLGTEIAATGELARKIQTLTGVERVNFCVTGTEAVFTTMRLARAHTGRPKIVLLRNGYHGHSDATLYGPKPGGRALRAATPNAPGVPASGAQDVLIGSVDDPELPQFLIDHGDEIAAVVMEPLQNQYPDRDLREFTVEMRRVTRSIGALLVLDEVLTGFRFAPGGFQELHGVEADLVAYGKTVGAGLPISVVAGRAEIMDLIDGGPWTRDLRVASDRLTYTAGTYVKHPLSVAAANAVMSELIERGPDFLVGLNERGDLLRGRIDAVLRDADAGVRVIGRGSAFRFVRANSTSFAFVGSDFHQFRRNLIAEGVYITETGLSYVSDAHTDDVLDEIVDAVTRAVRTSQDSGATGEETSAQRPLAVSLSFFGMQDAAHGGDFYDRVVRLAETADEGGLDAVWFPERHFDRFAGFSPNPAVLAALVAARTSRIGLRAGSAVLPLHSPVTVAEDWAMLDVASAGRVGVAVASGWMRRDFVLSEAPYEERRELFERRIDEMTRLWAGEKVRVESPAGTAAEVELFPKPLQARLPLWQAVLGDERSFRQAGRTGRNILTNLIQQDLDELRTKLGAYRDGRREAGLDPEGGEVTVLVHTAFTPDEAAREGARRDLENYMLQTFRSTHPDPGSLDRVDWTPRTRAAARRLLDGLSLVGTAEEWRRQCQVLRDAGATEISCLVDFVGEPDRWNATVEALVGLRAEINGTEHNTPATAVGHTRPSAVAERATAAAAPAAPPVAGTAAAPPVAGTVSAPPVAEPADGPVSVPAAAEPASGDAVALTRGAVEIWAASKSSPEAMAAYTIQRLFEIRGDVDPGRLRDAFHEVLRRDPALRLTVRPTGDGGIVPGFSQAHREAFVLYEGIAPDQESFCDRVASDLARYPLDPERGCAIVLRCRRSADGMLLHLAASHAIIDGTQFSEILEQVGRIYSGGSGTAELPPRPPVDTSGADADRTYWRKAVAGIPRDALDHARSRPVFDRSWRGRRYSRRLPADWLGTVKARGREQRVTPFVESFATTISSLDEFAGRPLLYSFPALRPRTEEYGSNANLLPLWAAPTTGDLRGHCRAAVLNGLRHGSLTFTQIFESETAGDPERRRITPDVTFAWDYFDSMSLGEAAIRELPMHTEVVRFPLAVTFTVEPGDTVTLSLDIGASMEDAAAEKCFETLYASLTERYEDRPAVVSAPVGPSSGRAAEALARAAAGAVRSTGDDWVRTLSLDGQEQPAGLAVSKARATAAAILERCDLTRIAGVRLSVDTEQDLLGAALVCSMLGLADRVGEGASGDGALLEIRAMSTGAGSSDDHVVVGLSAWTYFETDAPLPCTPSGPDAVSGMLTALAAQHASGRVTAVGRAAVLLAERTGTGTVVETPAEAATAEAPETGGAVPVAEVRAAWEKALGRTEFGDADDFFDLGGDSIAAIRVVAELNSRFGSTLPVNLVYLHPTVGELSAALGTEEPGSTDDSRASARG